MTISGAAPFDLDEAVACLVTAFEQDPITGFLLQRGAGYGERVAEFFSLLMRARLALGMPVLVARGEAGIQGAVMGYSTARPAWPLELTQAWDRFENSMPGLVQRFAIYDAIVARYRPPVPHYYLGAIGVDPRLRGRGIGKQLLQAFCEISAGDALSGGIYLETAKAENVGFYQHAGFVESGRGNLGSTTLWCMFLPHGPR